MQLRANKRQEVLLSKRQLGTGSHPPHLVVILSLSAKVDVGWIYSLLCGACDVDATPSTTPPAITLISHTLKQRFTLVFPPTDGDLYALLDVAKVRVLARTWEWGLAVRFLDPPTTTLILAVLCLHRWQILSF